MAGNFWDNDPVAIPPMPPKATSAGDQKRVGEMQGGFDEANNLANTATDFMVRNDRTKTGGALAIPTVPTVAKALGLGGPDLSAMDRDSAQMATQMRAPGMRLTQMEFGKFLGANPSIRTSHEQNASNAENIYAARTGAAAKSAFYTSFLNAHGNLNGADAGWLKFQNQHFSPDLKTYTANDGTVYGPGGKGQQLKARSAGVGQKAADNTTIDIFGRPVR